jgi:transposase
LKAIQAEYHDQKVEGWFQDEARFGQQGTLTRVWALGGSRPRVVRQTKYEWLYVMRAVCPETGQTVGLLSPNINTPIMNIFLEQFTQEINPDVQVILVGDQAGFHTSNDLKVPPHVTIVPLPAYSPELNPVENLWHYLRSHYGSHRSYENYEELRSAAIDAWQKAALDPEIVKSVCHTSYAERGN